jgi:hypothetical protein
VKQRRKSNANSTTYHSGDIVPRNSISEASHLAGAHAQFFNFNHYSTGEMIMTSSPTINTAIRSQLQIMEHFLHDMLYNVTEARTHIDAGERNAAIGALLGSQESFAAIQTLYNTILVMHRNADLVERQD